MLRADEEIFLDDMTLDSLAQALQVRICPVTNDGAEFVRALACKGEENL